MADAAQCPQRQQFTGKQVNVPLQVTADPQSVVIVVRIIGRAGDHAWR
jgi:hypothetical protein